MGQAMLELAGNSDLQFSMAGTEKTGNLQIPLALNVFLKNGFDGVRRLTQLDLTTYSNSALQERITADGVSLWTWKPAKKEYACMTYGNLEGGQPERYIKSLCQILDVEARGQAALAARLIHYAFSSLDSGNPPATDQMWAPWPAMADITLDGNDVVCTVGSPATMEVRYELEPYGQNQWKLKGVGYYEYVKMGAKHRETTWHLDIIRLANPIPPAAFVFIPPAGARAVSLPARSGG